MRLIYRQKGIIERGVSLSYYSDGSFKKFQYQKQMKNTFVTSLHGNRPRKFMELEHAVFYLTFQVAT